jgi:DNA-binding transcriptional ArsR family regulator
MQAKIIGGLANPKRLEIVQLLSHESLSVNRLVEMTGISQANLSQHLMHLRKVGVVSSLIQGQKRIYSLTSKHVAVIGEAARLTFLERSGVTVDEKLNSLQTYIDPVCGMEVLAHMAAASKTYKGKHYYFCATGCEKKCMAMPQSFLHTHQNQEVSNGN